MNPCSWSREQTFGLLLLFGVLARCVPSLQSFFGHATPRALRARVYSRAKYLYGIGAPLALATGLLALLALCSLLCPAPASSRAMKKSSGVPRKVVSTLLLALLLGGHCFHSPCPAGLRLKSASQPSYSTSVGPQRAGSTGDQMRQDAAEQGGLGIPEMLRDVVVEKIEELGGGKVKEVRGLIASPARHFGACKSSCVHL